MVQEVIFLEKIMFPTFYLLGKTIPTYALMSLIGIFVCGIYICKKAKQKGYDENNFIIVLLLSSIGVFFGGHILYAITRFDLIIKLFSNWNTYVHSFWDFIECAKLICGGSVFYGGLIGGMIVGFIYCKKKHYNLSDYSDIIAPGIPLFHFFGRIGCFLGGCCYGIESSFGFTVHNNQLLPSVNDVQRFPVQLLESLLNLILFFILAYLLKKELLKGKLFATYLLSYSVIRFFDEFLRGDTYRGFLLGLSTSQIISIVIFICSIIYLIYQGKKNNTHRKTHL